MIKFLKKYWFYFFILVMTIFVLIGLSDLIKPLFVVFLLAYLFNKPVTYLEKYYISRRLSTFFLIAFLIYILITIIVVAIPVMNQKLAIIAYKGPFILDDFIGHIEIWLQKWNIHLNPDYLEKIKVYIKDHILYTVRYTFFYSLNTFGRLFYFAALPFLTYYLTVDFPYLHGFFLSLFPKEVRNPTQDLIFKAGQMFSNYLHGQTLVCLLLSVMYGISLYIIGFKNPIIVGMIMGFLAFIPYLGALLGFFIMAAFVLADFYTLKMFLQVFSIFSVITILESQIIAPYIIGKKLGISPLVLILAIIIGHYYFGLIGMVLAYPLTATIIRVWQTENGKH